MGAPTMVLATAPYTSLRTMNASTNGWSSFFLGIDLNPPGGIIHGGLAMALLDSAMAVTCVPRGRGEVRHYDAL